MELLPDGGFVRLQSRWNRKYLHADGDWRKVSFRPLSRPVPSLEAVWRVEHWVSPDEEITYVLLQNAAYGRYLGHHIIQRDYDDPNLVDGVFPLRWSAERVDPDEDYVHLRHLVFHLGIPLTRRVPGHLLGALATTTHWRVHAVAATPLPLPLPVRPPWPPVQAHRRHRRRRWFWAIWRLTGYGPGVFEDVPREIRYVRGDDQGNFDQNQWRSFIDHDIPVVELRRYLANLQDDWTGNMLDFTLCIRPGSHGRLMPLVTHLPRSEDPLSIVVLRNGTPAAAALRYPLMYAPAPP